VSGKYKDADDVLLRKFTAVLQTHPNIGQRGYDLLRDPEKPGRATVVRRFGSFEAAKKLALPDGGTVANVPHIPPVFIDKKEGRLDWREMIRAAITQQDIIRRNSWSQDACKVEVPTSDPIAVAYTSDEHLGSIATDYTAWLDDIDFLLNTPGLYAVSAGDMIENQRAFKTVSAVINQIIPPDLQEEIVREITLELFVKNKLLAAGAGNHDTEFCERLYGKSNVEKIISRLVPFFNGKGAMELTVGNQKYTHLIIHKTRFNSFLNALHGAKREYQLTLPADVVVTAHTHKPAFEMYYQYEMASEIGMGIGPYSLLIKTGTYKTEDAYSKRYWTKGVIGTPTVVYMPDRREMTVFRTAREAVTYMEGIMGKKLAGQLPAAKMRVGT